MNQYEHFTSLPPNEEQTFVVYERRTVETGKKAMTIGMIASAVFGLLTIIVVFSHDKPKNLMADDDMGMLQETSFDEDEKESKPATMPDPEPAATDSDEATDTEGGEAAEGEAAEGEATDGEAAEAEATE